MISLSNIQTAYVDLYSQLRKYIWDYDVAVEIAELEIAAYRAFPDIIEIRNKLDRLQRSIQEVVIDDEELKCALDQFIKLVSEDTECYYKLDSVIQEDLT